MGMRCPHREDCFFMALRRETAAARILVVNHHLLFADLAARHAGAGWEATVVLPPYGRIILDEAHTVEAAATSFFSREWSRFAVYRLIGRLYRKRRGADPHIGAASGLLLQAPGFPRLDDAVECLERLRRAADNLDETALGICGEEAAYRFTRARRFQLETHLFPRLKIFREEIMSLIRIIEKYLESYLENSKDEEANPAIWELQALVRRLDALSATAENALEYLTREEDVVWMERRKGSADRSWVRFVITPVDVAPSLSEALFKPHKTVICVSATLTIAGNFSWWMSRAGLVAAQSAAQESAAGRAILTGMFPSPFPYATSVLLCSPADSPSPEQDGFPEFVDRAVRELVEISGGGALVLFTSYESLKSAYSASRGILESQGIRCLKQGDDDRARLLGAFLKDESSALFATDSFWEGVDAPGDTLRLVIICRLPFKAPRDPVFEARCEAIAARGGVPFMELSLPEAIMKFKQGFGRLMRRSSDRGVVAVLDSRVLHKQYGGLFLRSLPQTRTLFGEFSAILREAESFLFDK
jgi:ATP-dependent DNA helicase DinG